jgi:hypothetical protein
MANIPGPNDIALTNFLAALNVGTAPATLVETYFCPNGVDANGKPIPTVGLTDYAHAPLGPVFSGQADITTLFTQLFKTFSGFAFTELTPSATYRLYTLDTTQIAVQATMTGIKQASWFPKTSNHYSQPISDITTTGKKMTTPVCAVFAFDNANKIRNLSLFFDRYRMQLQLKQ